MNKILLIYTFIKQYFGSSNRSVHTLSEYSFNGASTSEI